MRSIAMISAPLVLATGLLLPTAVPAQNAPLATDYIPRPMPELDSKPQALEEGSKTKSACLPARESAPVGDAQAPASDSSASAAPAPCPPLLPKDAANQK